MYFSRKQIDTTNVMDKVSEYGDTFRFSRKYPFAANLSLALSYTVGISAL